MAGLRGVYSGPTVETGSKEAARRNESGTSIIDPSIKNIVCSADIETVRSEKGSTISAPNGRWPSRLSFGSAGLAEIVIHLK